MKIFSNPRFLVVYSAVVTVAFAVTLLCGFAAGRNQTFDVLTVHRIDFVEPDGTPRLIISNREQFLAMTGAALADPVSRMWKGHGQRAAI